MGDALFNMLNEISKFDLLPSATSLLGLRKSLNLSPPKPKKRLTVVLSFFHFSCLSS